MLADRKAPDALNERLQAVLNPGGALTAERRLFGQLFRRGDRVMQTRNDYEREVYNGDIGRIVEIDPIARALKVRMDERDIDYCDDDLEALTQRLMAPQSTVCGRIPILTLLLAGQQLGADAAQVLHYTTSGDVTGERAPGQYTVGYMAAAVYRS